MASESDNPRPRVSLALPDGPLRKRLLEVLADVDVEVEVVDTDSVTDEVQEGEADVVVIGDDIALDELDDLTTGDKSDADVAIIGDTDAAERARMLAAGASHVLNQTESAAILGAKIEALAAVPAGGRDPDVRGGRGEPSLADFMTRDAKMRRFVELVRRVVPVDTSLLITGPTGVGKERLARAIHAEGPRAEQPFVSINCGALPDQLLESELFGHEKGAFTGAERARQGHFELASGGTIFLDEIGEMPAHLQVKLLTVVQRHEVTRLGSETPLQIDVRLIAATNRDLAADVAAGRFREDLLFRINVLALEIPSLAERPDDVIDLAGRFIAHFREHIGSTDIETISEPAVRALLRYDWPGNVRELINVIERAMVLGKGPAITVDDLPDHITSGTGATSSPAALGGEVPDDWLSLPLKEVRELAVGRAERAYLRGLLRQTDGQLAETAKRAGIGPRALYNRMKAHDLDKDDFKPSDGDR